MATQADKDYVRIQFRSDQHSLVAKFANFSLSIRCCANRLYTRCGGARILLAAPRTHHPAQAESGKQDVWARETIPKQHVTVNLSPIPGTLQAIRCLSRSSYLKDYDFVQIVIEVSNSHNILLHRHVRLV